MIPGSLNELSIKKVKTIKQRTPPAINIALVHVFVTKSALNTINNMLRTIAYAIATLMFQVATAQTARFCIAKDGQTATIVVDKYDWKSVLGMNITLENQEWATYTNGLGEHAFGVARLGWIADYNDPITYLELLD